MKNNNKILKILSIILIFFILLSSINVVNADRGAKPSITIYLKNMNTKNYLIDLLVYDETGENYASPLNYNGKEGEQYDAATEYEEERSSLKTITIKQLETLYKINYDGWISESTRWGAYLLFADCSGNDKFKHVFSYFGTPETYKVVIINNDTGEIRVTDVIKRTDFTSNITIDFDSMNVKTGKSSFGIIKTILASLLLTITIEVLVAYFMNIKNIKAIIIANIITNILLQLALIYIPAAYLLKFIIAEILVIFAEYLIYSFYFNNVSRKEIAIYTILANVITAILTFII